MRTIEAIFEVAIYPEGVSGYHFEEDDEGCCELVEDIDIFEKHKCCEKHSSIVLEYLKDAYDRYTNNDIEFRSLKFDKYCNTFSVQITFKGHDLDDDDEIEYVDELILPGDVHDEFYLFIDSQIHFLHIKLCYYSDVEEDEQAGELILEEVHLEAENLEAEEVNLEAEDLILEEEKQEQVI